MFQLDFDGSKRFAVVAIIVTAGTKVRRRILQVSENSCEPTFADVSRVSLEVQDDVDCPDHFAFFRLQELKAKFIAGAKVKELPRPKQATPKFPKKSKPTRKVKKKIEIVPVKSSSESESSVDAVTRAIEKAVARESAKHNRAIAALEKKYSALLEDKRNLKAQLESKKVYILPNPN